MKKLITGTLLLTSLTAFADCKLFIGNMTANSGEAPERIFQETQKVMTSKGYLIVLSESEASYQLSGSFVSVQYDGDPGRLDSNTYIADMNISGTGKTISKSGSTMYFRSNEDIRSLRKALKKFSDCRI